MPGTTFLPGAGPLGTVIGMAIGGLAMCVFAWCYHVMIVRNPGLGGSFSFAWKTFGYDHGFLLGWFLCVTYVAVLWANATSLIMMVRFTFDDALQFGFHYTLKGFDIYFGEVLLSIVAILLGGGVCLWGRRLAANVQTLLMAVFVGSVAVIFSVALFRHTGGLAAMAPAFSGQVRHPFSQIFVILAMAPWAFVGFEAISHSSAEFRFPLRRTFGVLIAAVMLAVVVYLALALLPVLSFPAGYSTWAEYVRAAPGLDGIRSVPVFMAAKTALGDVGIALMVAAMLAGQVTAVIATLAMTSRLMCAMAREDVLPHWLGKLDKDATPRNAILFIMALSFAIPFLGRAVICWPMDISSIGAAIAYGYASAAAYKTAEGRGTRLVGLVGIVLSIVFALLLLVPNYLSGCVMEAESYLLLAVWCIIVFFFYRRVFLRDRLHRFGQSTVV